MKNALQEQLLKAGLATEDQMRKKTPRKGKKPSGPANKKARRKPSAGAKKDGDIDLKTAYAERRREEKQAEEKARAEAARRKANKAKVNKLIEENAQDTSTGSISYQFIVGKNIKKLWVTEAQRDQLVSGELGITFLGGKRCVITREVAEQITSLDPKKIIVMHRPEAEGNQDTESDIPDDLMW